MASLTGELQRREAAAHSEMNELRGELARLESRVGDLLEVPADAGWPLPVAADRGAARGGGVDASEMAEFLSSIASQPMFAA